MKSSSQDRRPARERLLAAADELFYKEFGGEVLAFGPWEVLFGEGAYHNGMIVRFPDKDTALAWYNSPTYQALLDIRNAALDCRFRLVG
jgi:uncharacterized protein (DUF1330 family)